MNKPILKLLLAGLIVNCLSFQLHSQTKLTYLSFTELLSFKNKDSASIVAVLIKHGFKRDKTQNLDNETNRFLVYKQSAYLGPTFYGALEKGKLTMLSYSLMNDTASAILMVDSKKAGFTPWGQKEEGFHGDFKKGDMHLSVTEKSYSGVPKPVQTFLIFFYPPKMPKQ